MDSQLERAPYISLETFRPDGSGVRTPVWVAPLDGRLVVGTQGTTFKVKRIRVNPKVRLAMCNASGKKILGRWFDGSARILDSEGAARANVALAAKYGWQRRAFQWFARLAGRAGDPVYFEITVA